LSAHYCLGSEIAAGAISVLDYERLAETRLTARSTWTASDLLKLRSEFEGGPPLAPEKYLDLSYYRRALAAM
jgi:hypothetical protein